MGIDLRSCKCISCRSGMKPIATKFQPLTITSKQNTIAKKKKKITSGKYMFLSILSTLSAFLLGLLSIGNALSHTGSGSAVLVFFALSIISIIGSFILAAQARRKGAKLGRTILSIGIAVLTILFLFPLFFV